MDTSDLTEIHNYLFRIGEDIKELNANVIEIKNSLGEHLNNIEKLLKKII
ncbi:MAG: hypothetical protein PHD83_05600 [Caldisericia bacterium]|nr:hypothetical protein [Caldisericia bacterium]